MNDRDEHQALSIVLAVIVGVLLAAAVLHFWEPCAEGTLCALAALTPTRMSLWQRVRGAAEAAYWRWLLAAAQNDMQHWLETQRHLPAQIHHVQRRIDYLARRARQAGSAGH